jgi:hypothetical protein
MFKKLFGKINYKLLKMSMISILDINRNCEMNHDAILYMLQAYGSTMQFFHNKMNFLYKYTPSYYVF